MRIYKFLVFVFLFAWVGCHPAGPPVSSDFNDSDGIIGGRDVGAAEAVAKSTVALVTQEDQGHALCTGTILDEETILTAAHCVDHDPEQLLVVFAPQVESVPSERVRSADAFVQNPRWKTGHETGHETGRGQSGRGDLALIHFTGGLPTNSKPVVLADRDLDLAVEQKVVLAGYGVSDAGSHSGAGSLRQTQSRITAILSPTQIVTDGRKSSVCFGDSGGPAFLRQGKKWLQWGVASSVTRPSCDEASVHTDLRPYRTWLQKAAADLKQNPAPGETD